MTKEEFATTLHELDINKKEFAQIANIPHSTVLNWGVFRSGKVLEIPNWVQPFLHFYKRSTQVDIVMNNICDQLSQLKN